MKKDRETYNDSDETLRCLEKLSEMPLECFESSRRIQKIEYDDFRTWMKKNLSYRFMTLERPRRDETPVLRDLILANRSSCSGKSVQVKSELDSARLKYFDKLWLYTDKKHSNIFEYELFAAANSARPQKSRRNGYWCPGHTQNIILSVPLDSIVVESTGLVLQRWRDVCSFSRSICCYWSGYGGKYLSVPHPREHNQLRVRSCSDQTQKLKVTMMNISIT